jgi:AAA family ATP:ADP antiporter
MRSLACRWLGAKPHELAALGWAFAYFFLLLAGYYVLRPVRDEMAVQAGTAVLPWLFTATFGAMLLLVPLWGWLCARLPRARLLVAVYAFFAANLVLFWLAHQSGASLRHLAAVFFVWLSVFNLFVVSVFWSFMADLFDAGQAARLYGAIAAGGSCGAIAGPALTALAVTALGPANLFLVSAAILCVAMVCIYRLSAWSRLFPRQGERQPEEPLGGTVLAGLRAALSSPFLLAICGYLLCYTMLSTSLYFQQVEIVGAAIAQPAERTRLFATVDLVVNSLTLVVQLALTARLGARLGPGWMLALMPLVSVAGFLALGAAPALAVLLAFGIIRRVGEFAISKPVREALYTVVAREERYKAKNFIDTAVYRGGDAFSGWLFGALKALGLGLAGIAFAAVPVAAAWAALGFWLGAAQSRLRDEARRACTRGPSAGRSVSCTPDRPKA